MPTPYLPILDSEIDPDSPVNEYLLRRLRDNLIAAIEGASGAPLFNAAALNIGGSEADGLISNATSHLTSFIGSLDAAGNSSRSTPWNLSPCTVIRIKGNFTLSSVIRIQQSMNLSTNYLQRQLAKTYLNAKVAPHNVSGGTAGLSVFSTLYGAELTDENAVAIPFPSSLSKLWQALRIPSIPGNGTGTGGQSGFEYSVGGGHLTLIVDGDFNCTGGTINCDATNTDDLGPGGGQPDGGSGGSLSVICTGTLTGGTFTARGASTNSPGGFGFGAPGHGGLISLVANAFSGTQTFAVAGGTNQAGANGRVGYSVQETVSANVIRSMLQRY